MRRIEFAVVLAISVLLTPIVSEAQATKIWRIGILSFASPASPGPLTALLQGLRDAGLVEGPCGVVFERWVTPRMPI
jgi:hypothetical protein